MTVKQLKDKSGNAIVSELNVGYLDLAPSSTLSSGIAYTADSDGYVRLQRNNTASGVLAVKRTSTGSVIYQMSSDSIASQVKYVPIRKGWTYYVEYPSGGGQQNFTRFKSHKLTHNILKGRCC